ncbi:MAG: DNA-directed RNA polymerase subunit beta' [Candidatus Aerophobetes bacterium]|nr:DNA-directed RNA polymerase subunit beta' [Candidatus Aerophobetes bacterium]
MDEKIIDFTKFKPVVDVPSLLQMQRISFENFLQRDVSPDERKNEGLQAVFRDVFPVESYNEKLVLEFVEYRLNGPRYSIEKCGEEELTYSLFLYVKLRLKKKETGEVTEQEIYLGNLPLMTERGSFIINGAERVVISQLQRSPGLFFEENPSVTAGGDGFYKARIIPERGSWLDFEIKKDLLYTRINRGRKFLATLFIRAMEGVPEQIIKEFTDFKSKKILKESFEQDGTKSQKEALLKVYRRLRPGHSAVFESAKEVFHKNFLDPRRYNLGKTGRYQLNRELSLNGNQDKEVLQLKDVVGVIKHLFKLNREKKEIKSIDHLSYRRVRRIGELLANQLHLGLVHLARIIQQGMSIQDPDKVTPRSLINTSVVRNAINSFFNTGPLSQYLDQTNPLSELTHKRRLSALGPGGLTRVQAKEEVRDVHYTHYGRICPVETPEGQNIGLITSLASYAKINELGFLETPYRKVREKKAAKEIVYLDAREEDNCHVAGADAVDREGNFIDPEVITRYKGEIVRVAKEEVDYVDVSPKQLVSITTSLIPFLESDEANRALMGSNMQRQAMPLENPEEPLVQTGIEGKVTKDSMAGVVAKKEGEVIYVDADKVSIRSSNRVDVYNLIKFRRSNQKTCINQRVLASKGDEVKEGTYIADGPAMDKGKLSLGRNVLVAFMPWEGYNFEDAILISEKLVKEDIFTSIHIEEFQVEAKELKSGVEEITADVPNVEETALKDLDEEGIIRIGAEIKPGDIIVGKVTPQVEIKLTPEERLLRSIFGEKAQKVKDNSLKIPPGVEGKVIKVKVFSQDNKDNLPPDVRKRVKVYVAIRHKIGVGDKMSGRHGNKGVVSRVLPEEDMPYLPDGTPIEVVLNPLGVPSRMNIGQILEMHLGWIAKTLGVHMICPVFEGPLENEIRKLLKKAHLPESGKTILYDGRTGKPFHQPVAVGYMYMMKLIHLANEKVHARSTGPYALITQQPLGGRSRQGGQRFGEMEVWALEGYGAAYTLQEMLTNKSDDLQGRTRVHEEIVKGENTLSTRTPESFKVLIKELQALGLNLEFWKNNKRFSIKGMEEREKPWEMDDIDKIKIRLASPEEIRKWSYGEVRKTDTINYRTFRPERGGLFCEQIFGPTKSYECYCGKYRKMKYKGVKCERCGVEVTSSKVRRERMGHIELSTPVTHIWYIKKYLPSLLNLKKNEIERIIYFVNYLVTDPGRTPLKKLQILSEEEYQRRKQLYGEDTFRAGMGAEAILQVLRKMNLEELMKRLREKLLEERSKTRRIKLIRRLEVIEKFVHSGNKPEWIILKVIPVIPPDFRPMVQLENGVFANSDLNDLYRRIINRNNRLKYLLDIGAPQIIIQNEKKMLQQSVDALIENEKISQPILGAARRPLKSLSEIMKGKQGRFRQNLLGKRVDYSGRAVIVPGPDLKLHQCGVPEKMALELFRPFVLAEILRKGEAETIKRANDFIEKADPFVWEILERVVEDHPVLLNRAPTLHRLGMQAFQPVLIEGSAIQLHPLACTAFNADFDGDQMAIHTPLSFEAQLEGETLMLSTNNIISPAHGKPIIFPTQDIIVGCYYLTLEKNSEEEERSFLSQEEVIFAYELGKLALHQKVRLRQRKNWISTTPGRVIFNQALPEGMEFKNCLIDKKVLKEIVSEIWKKYGNICTVEVLDKIKKLGFEYATNSGLTFSISDIPNIPDKEKFLQEMEEEAEGYNMRAEDGEISEEERYIDVIDLRVRATEQIEKKASVYLSENIFNPLYLMWKSGARGSKDQLRQIVGMKGLMSRSIRETYRRELWDEVFKRQPDISPTLIRQYFYPLSGGRLRGRIIEEPIRSSFKDGLTTSEYFFSTSGGRKGLVDTALKTAYAGYLTRKLVAVAQNIIISEEDCGTIDGLYIAPLIEGGKLIKSLSSRIVGRVTASPVVDPSTNQIIVDSNEEITEEIAEKIEKAGIKKMKVRSPLTCQTKRGLCRRCYGWDLSTHKLVNIGEAIGIIAAQSIGEPGTQLTLRTFHTGGIFQKGGDIPQGLPRATELFEPRKYNSPQEGSIRRREGEEALISEIEGIVKIESNQGRSFVKIQGEEGKEIIYEAGEELLVSEGDKVKAGEKIVEGSVNPRVLLNIKGVRAVEEYLVNQTQRVYLSQGVDIDLKHFEVIIRQMMRKVKIEDSGDAGYLLGEEVDKVEFEEVNKKIKQEGGKPATVKPVLLAIPKAVQEDKGGFLSAASFQRTKQVLVEAAVCGQVDQLKGLKENVIVGKLIPAGTGFNIDSEKNLLRSN